MEHDLFTQNTKKSAPLADRMRPKTLEAFFGQTAYRGQRQAAAPCDRDGQLNVVHLLRSAGVRKDDAGICDRRNDGRGRRKIKRGDERR